MKKSFVMFAACLALASCGSSTKKEAATQAAFTSVSPVKDFMIGKDSKGNAASIEEDRVADCMRKAGWSYESIFVVDLPDATEPTNPQALLEWRKKYGYGYFNHPDSPTDTKAAANRQEAYEASLSPDARRRYMTSLGYGMDDEEGNKPSGCRGEVEAKLKTSFPEFNRAIASDVLKQRQASAADPRLVEANNAWTQCMGGRGLKDIAITDLSDRFAKGENTSELRTKELQVATADAECSMTTIWPVTWRIESDIIQGIVDKYGSEATCRDKCSR